MRFKRGIVELLRQIAALIRVDRGSQCGLATRRVPELKGESRQEARLRELAAGSSQSLVQDFFITEPLKYRDEVGKSLVKREHVRSAGPREVSAQTVEQSMSDFVSDDV